MYLQPSSEAFEVGKDTLAALSKGELRYQDLGKKDVDAIALYLINVFPLSPGNNARKLRELRKASLMIHDIVLKRLAQWIIKANLKFEIAGCTLEIARNMLDALIREHIHQGNANFDELYLRVMPLIPPELKQDFQQEILLRANGDTCLARQSRVA